MGLTAGIVGLPNVGKSTLFNAITNSKVLAANYPFATIEPNVGYVDINDPRLYHLADVLKPPKVVPASFSFTDIAGLVKGASKGEGLGNQFLSHIRPVDAICQVVRCFSAADIVHIAGDSDPILDIETINLELIFADLEIVERRLPRIEKRALLKVDRNATLEYQALKKIEKLLNEGLFASAADLLPGELAMILPYNFLTLKPMIYVLNVGDDDLKVANETLKKIRDMFIDVPVITINAQIEAELADLDFEQRQEYLSLLGIEKSGLDQLVAETYRVLGLANFFTTTGDKEIRAWTFREGMTARECAGLIHTDFEKGFIRAEVLAYDDFNTYGNMQKAREAGKIRSEGRDYLMKDGDIVMFRFNI